MFTIFLHEGMNPFYENISSFPTVIFSIVLGVSILFWLIAILGLADIDALDIDLDNGESGGIGGILVKLGLNGVPLTIIVSFLSFFGWIASYILVAIVNPIIPGRFLELLAGVPILFGSLYVAALATSVVIKPIRMLFKKMEVNEVKHIIGQVAVVRSSRVDEAFGEAILEDGGAGLLLRVRSRNGEEFRKGARVVLLEHDKVEGTYTIISEDEFNNEN